MRKARVGTDNLFAEHQNAHDKMKAQVNAYAQQMRSAWVPGYAANITADPTSKAPDLCDEKYQYYERMKGPSVQTGMKRTKDEIYAATTYQKAVELLDRLTRLNQVSGGIKDNPHTEEFVVSLTNWTRVEKERLGKV